MKFYSRQDSNKEELVHYYAIVKDHAIPAGYRVKMNFIVNDQTGTMHLTGGIVPICAHDKGQYGIMFEIPSMNLHHKNRWLTEITGELFLKVMLESKIYEAGITIGDN